MMRLFLACLLVLVPRTANAVTPAPGAPGTAGTWAPAQKSLLGTALGTSSRVYFTGHRGVLTELFYPRLDTVQSVDLEFFVADKAGTFVDEERQQGYVSVRPDRRCMRWQTLTGNVSHHWRLSKEIFTDSQRSSLVVRVTFEAQDGRAVGDFDLFVFHDPSMNDSSADDRSRTRSLDGRTMLVASEGTYASALASSRPWVRRHGRSMVSNGFVGVSDGRTDLATDHTMNWMYDLAEEGNVAQLGWVEPGEARQRHTFAFTIVLGFGTSEKEAMATAIATLRTDVQQVRERYDNEWHAYVDSLESQGGTADEQYYLAAMTLKVVQDKSNGAMVAGMGTPWGEASNDANPAGYHMVWARDIFKFANALITAGDLTAGFRVVRYLFEVLQQKVDCGAVEGNAPECPQGYARKGRFPQNAWVDGRQYWTATQMDEQAMPLVLAWRVWDQGGRETRQNVMALWPAIRATADYLVANGPWTQEERWEESSGYSPSTIAAEVAGLVAAGELARVAGDTERAGHYLAAADYWQQNAVDWTFTTTGPLGDHNYFVRLNPARRFPSGIGLQRYDPIAGPDDATILAIGNGSGSFDQRAIIDGGFIELVRLGVRRATDPAIQGSLPEYDATLRQRPANKGDAWFRYNHDGYGERNDGKSYDGSHGHGRLWPILTAERGMYEIARTGDGASGKPYLAALKAFATPEGFIPEQVWTESHGSVITPPSYTPGTPTDSIAPLHWAMGEYINLLASIHAGAVVDTPRILCSRYSTCNVQNRAGEVTIDLRTRAETGAGQRVYVTGDAAALGNWNTDLGIPLDPSDYPVWNTRLQLSSGRRFQYRYYRKNIDGSVTWEVRASRINREHSTPPSGSAQWTDESRW